jgi:hypothetical protein
MSWDGSAWSLLPSPNPATGSYHYNFLTGVSCVAATCTAAGSYGHSTEQSTTSSTLIEAGPLPGTAR